MAAIAQNIQNITFSSYVEPRRRIGNVAASFLLALALTVDAAQFFVYLIGFVPFIGLIIAAVVPPLITVLAWISFYFIYKLLGVNFIDSATRKMVTFFGSALIELMPIISSLPAWTLGTLLMILIVRAEDAHYNKQSVERQQEAAEAIRERSADILELDAYRRQRAQIASGEQRFAEAA